MLLLSVAFFGSDVFVGFLKMLPLYAEMMRQSTWSWNSFVSVFALLRYFGVDQIGFLRTIHANSVFRPKQASSEVQQKLERKRPSTRVRGELVSLALRKSILQRTTGHQRASPNDSCPRLGCKLRG
jgi:uncharacterized membrane protein